MKTYTYKNGKIDKEFKINKTDTLLFGKFSYDDDGRIKQIERIKDSVYFIESYQYEKGGGTPEDHGQVYHRRTHLLLCVKGRYSRCGVDDS